MTSQILCKMMFVLHILLSRLCPTLSVFKIFHNKRRNGEINEIAKLSYLYVFIICFFAFMKYMNICSNIYYIFGFLFHQKNDESIDWVNCNCSALFDFQWKIVILRQYCYISCIFRPCLILPNLIQPGASSGPLATMRPTIPDK